MTDPSLIAELAPVTFGIPNAAFPVLLLILSGMLVRIPHT